MVKLYQQQSYSSHCGRKEKKKLLPKVATTEWIEVRDKNLHFVGLTNNAEMPDQIHILKQFCSSNLEVFVT